MPSKLSPVSLSIPALLILSVLTMMIPSVYAQEETAEGETEQYQNDHYGFSFSYPADWAYDDFTADYSQSLLDATAQRLGYTFLGYLCPEDVAIPSFAGSVNCDSAEDLELMGFLKLENLDNKVANRGATTSSFGATTPDVNITTDDVFAYYAEVMLAQDNEETTTIDESRTVQAIVSSTPFAIDIVDAATGQVVGQAQAEMIEYVYAAENVIFQPSTRAYQVFAVHGDDGYTFGLEGTEDEVDSGEVPEALQTVASTFRILGTQSSAPTTP